jgi:ribosomal protein L14
VTVVVENKDVNKSSILRKIQCNLVARQMKGMKRNDGSNITKYL